MMRRIDFNDWQRVRSAIGEGVRALLADRESSGRWTWVGPRRVIVAP